MNGLRGMKKDPPDAIVIDLSNRPSHGLAVALSIRQQKPTRLVPILFAGGEPAKVEGVRKVLPDATYTEWGRIRSDLKKSIAKKPTTVLTPPVIGYSGTPLLKKLGVKEDITLALVSAPDDFDDVLGELPNGVKVIRKANGKAELTIWFVRTNGELKRGISKMSKIPDKGGLWIAWPKKTSRLAGDVGEKEVRATGLAAGIVDYKICAIDETWSGLKFANRRAK